MPTVSVILTSFNHEKYIREAIDSTLNQTFTDFDLIILDDCSSDNSWDLINQYSDPRIKVFRNEVNKGPVAGVNKAISAMASGEYIAIHHSDDVWEPDKLEKQVVFLDANPEIGAVFTNALVITEDGSPLADEKHSYYNIFDQPNRTRHEWLRFFFSRGNALCHPSVLIRKSCYEDCGLYRYDMAQVPDLDMWIRLCLKYEIHVFPEKFVKFRVLDNEANTSGNRPEVRIRLTYELYKLLQNYRKFTSFDDLVKIFPSAERYYRNEETDLDFVLAMVALEEKPSTFTQLFGQDLLFEAISDPKRAATIKHLYDFDYKNFIALTAQHDVFSREEVSNLWGAVAERDGQISTINQAVADREAQVSTLNQAVAERDGQVSALNQVVAECDGQVSALYNSTSWRITRPLRIVAHQMKRVRRVAELAMPAIKRGGGLKNTFKKAIQLYRREGLAGIKRGFRIVAASDEIRLFNADSAVFLGTVSCRAGELLEPRVLIMAELSIPQCTKYRVKQKQEMLESLGINCTVYSWTDSNACISALSTHSLVIFYRVPAFQGVLEIIAEAKRLNIPTIWEADDLIFDREVLAGSKTLTELDQTTCRGLLEGADLYRKAMLTCDKGIASTTGVSFAMKKAGVPQVFVIENALDWQTLISANMINSSPSKPKDSFVRIVYGSGTNTHNVDFKEASIAILHVLKSFPNVRFRLIGTLDLSEEYVQHESQIERIPFCPYEEYLSYLAECDINIAPLEDYIFNDVKSNIKFIEASVLRIPSICSPRSAFCQAITHGVNGFLCDTQDEWINGLTLLVTDVELRNQIGSAAYASVIDTYSPNNIAKRQLLPLIKEHHNRPANKLRILSVNVFYAPRSFGGATIVAEETNKILNDKADFDIYVFTTLPLDVVSAYAVRRYEVDGVSIFGLGLPDTSDPKAQFENPHVLNAFESVLSAVKPDLVHFHCIQGIGVSVADLCFAKGIKYVVTLHDAWWVCGRQFMVNRQGKFCNQQRIDQCICDSCVDDAELNRYRQAKLDSALKNADLLLSPSQYFADFYVENGFSADNVLVNKNGILKPAIQRRRRREGPLTFGYVGGNTEIKGVHLIKKAFIDLHDLDIKLIVVDNAINLGFSSYEKSFFEGMINVEIVPAYTQKTIDDFFSRIDVLLFPTQWKESFGLTIREALARNAWVISTDAGGVVEDIDHGKNGFIVPLDDRGEAFKQAVQDTVQYYQQFKVGSEICLKTKQITWFEDQANELVDIYKRVIGEK
jgi:glycosyltransferase involved in cell wall biosynthesis